MSISRDERTLYQDDQDKLSVMLENKSRDEINDILEDYKYLLIKDRPSKYSAAMRLTQVLTIPLMIVLICLMPIKWVLTGDKYLDSWFKKIGVDKFKDYFL